MQNNGNNKAIMTAEQVAIEEVKRLVNIVVGLSNQVFKKDVDFGIIPGTGDKPTLLQPGMEKLLKALHLRAEYIERSKIEDFDRALFFYRYECRLIDWETGICVGTAIGSANSHEKKWRWREAKRKCPICGMETINKSKDKPEWYCWKKIGGCGATFPEADARITGQSVGRVENEDIFDQMNTCDKIAQKRSLGSAIKTVANVSMLYTVDLEDFQPYDTSRSPAGEVIEGTLTVVEGQKSAQPSEARPAASPQAKAAKQQPEPPSIDDFPPFGVEPTHEPETPMLIQHPQAPDGDVNVYHCDRLVIEGTRTSRRYKLVTTSDRDIVPLNLDVFEPMRVGETPVFELKTGFFPLSPVWSVTADFEADGWHVHSIEVGFPVE